MMWRARLHLAVGDMANTGTIVAASAGHYNRYPHDNGIACVIVFKSRLS